MWQPTICVAVAWRSTSIRPASQGPSLPLELALRRLPQGRWSGAGMMFAGADLVIDALFGGGFRGDLPDLAAWRASEATLAVDVPSGLSATTGEAARGVLPADATVTFSGPKVGHLIGAGPGLSGDVKAVDIGLPDVEPEFWLCEEGDAPLPHRSRDAHKWLAGSVLVVGGSGGLDGAATLTARAALRAGAGAVMIACPPSVEEKVRAPEIMTRAIDQWWIGVHRSRGGGGTRGRRALRCHG